MLLYSRQKRRINEVPDYAIRNREQRVIGLLCINMNLEFPSRRL